MAAGNIVNRQLALLFGEGRVLAMPANDNAMPAQNGAFLRREKSFVLLKRSVDAVPGVGPLAVAVGDAIEAVENAAVMRGMDLGIVIQATGDNPISLRRKHVMENLIGPNSTCRRGLVEPFVVIRHDRSLAEHEIGMMAGVIAPGEASRAWRDWVERVAFSRTDSPAAKCGRIKCSSPAALEVRPGPVHCAGIDLPSVAGKRDGCNPFLADLTARHRHSHGDIVTFVPPRCDGEIKRRGSTKGPGGSREVNCHASKG